MTSLPIWNLKELIPAPSGIEFDTILNDVKTRVAAFERKRSLLTPLLSSDEFNTWLNELEDIEVILNKLSAYGDLWFAEDTSSDEAKAYLAKVEQISAEVSNKIVFFDVWWKKLDNNTAQRILNDSGKNRYFLENARKFREHTLGEREEQIINLKDLSGVNALSKLYDILTNSFSFPFIVDGQKKKLTQSELVVQVRNAKPEMREAAYKVLLKMYKKNKAVLGEVYCAIVRDWYNEQLTVRKYKSPIEVRNKGNDIPDEAVKVMLDVCKENTGVFKKYFEAKAKVLGLSKMNRFHLYAPVSGVEQTISWNDGVKIVLETFHAFSPKISELAKKVLDTHHLHAPLGNAKRSGAFCHSVTPTMVPFVLVNYAGVMRDVITLAHELGHAIHTQLASDKTIFTFHAPLPLAETASVFGELMVTHKLLEQEKNPVLRRHLIAAKLDDYYATIQRQAFFTLFEQEAHEMIRGGALLKDISNQYHKNLSMQFGHDFVPKVFEDEWLYIPHIFHTPFYCYAYSFGNLLTLALYQMYKNDGASFVPKYLTLLSYGGSESPEKVLNELGINIRDKAFWQRGFDAVKELVDEFECSI